MNLRRPDGVGKAADDDMAGISLSTRALRTPPSPIRRLAYLATQARSAGVHVHHLNIGQPDVATPASFLEGVERFSDRVVAYNPSEGCPKLRAVWSDYMNRTLGLDTSADEFLITMGASEALIFIFMTCCDPGDEVIVFDPTYANYIGFASIAGVNLIPVHSRLDDGFDLPPLEAITDRLSPRTKAILLCSPNNPTGTVYDRAQLRMLLDLCRDANLFLVVDETYRELVFDGRTPLSVLHLDPANERVIVVDSLSKRFSLCGARIGALYTTNQELMAKTLNLAQARLAAPAIEQYAAAHMLENLPADYVDSVRQGYQDRRDVMYARLCDLPDVVTHLPSGAFYTIARLPVEDAEHFASFLLSDFSLDGQTVFVAPASGFYMGYSRGHNKVRIAYVLEPDHLADAARVLKEGLCEYRKRQ